MAIHLKNIKSEDLGEVTLLVGDPARVKLVADSWENTQLIVNSREFVVMNGYWEGRKVSICSTGIGVGSTEIAIIELIEKGAKYLIRVGGCGSWQTNIQPGSIIINHAMAREEGYLFPYVSNTYPAVADPFLVGAIKDKAQMKGFDVFVGIGLTTQSYYLGQDRLPDIHTGPQKVNLMSYWKERSILNCDMETAAIYILSSLYNVRACNCLVVHGNRHSNQWVPDQEYHELHQKAANLVLDACFKTMEP